LFSPHENHAEIGVRPGELRVDGEGAAKGMFGLGELPAIQRLLSLLEK
jgi:hypothetical protein